VRRRQQRFRGLFVRFQQIVGGIFADPIPDVLDDHVISSCSIGAGNRRTSGAYPVDNNRSRARYHMRIDSA
jgi:hypothetical protein